MSIPFVHLHLHSHYSILDGIKKSVLFFLSLVLFFFIQSCTKEDNVDFSFLSKTKRAIDKRIGSNGIYTIPVNLLKYNNRHSTKSSSVDTSYYFCLDSMIDQSLVRQVYFEKSGWLYNQTPFKSNVDGIYAAIGASPEHIKDSLVKIKSFFLQVNNIYTGVGSEYIVTMLPTKHYSTLKSGFDFLEKPSFSGIILYSDKNGNLLRTEYLENGLINQCSLKPHAAVDTKSPHTKTTIYTCSECGGETLEPDGVCIFCKYLELNSIVILGNGVNWDNYISMCLYELAQELGYIAPDMGGGGSNPELGGGYIEDLDTKASVVCRGDHCFQALLTIRFVTKGSVFSYTAPLRGSDNTCWFKEWIYDTSIPQNISTNRNSIVIQSVQESQTLVADYSTNSSCSEIQDLMQDGKIQAALDTLFRKVVEQNNLPGFLKIEYVSVWYNDSKGLQVIAGTNDNTLVPLDKYNGVIYGEQLIHHSHYHPSGNLRLSVADYVALCMFFLYDCSSLNTSTFSLITNNEVMVIKMKNSTTFHNYINNYLINSNTPDWYNKQRQVLIDVFSDLYSEKKIYNNRNNTYEYIDVIKSIIDEMGLQLYWGTLINGNSEQKSIQWNNTEYTELTPILLGCFTHIQRL